MPSFGMYTVEGTVARWLKPSGAHVEAGEPVLEIETEKALADVQAPESGILHRVAEPGALVRVEELLGYVLAPGEAPPVRPTAGVGAPARSEEPLTAPAPTGGGAASPNARRVAAELGVDLASVRGTGPGGRITETDVRTAVDGEAG
jgi:pyruvate dehydrogenase E2 component (dihydrolipoamide acetyltransferase)